MTTTTENQTARTRQVTEPFDDLFREIGEYFAAQKPRYLEPDEAPVQPEGKGA